ncbi:hypothetical protein [Streptomyces sp. NBC_01716]|nr:hypothetical protein [Streptomyces sp. NBC_01716]
MSTSACSGPPEQRDRLVSVRWSDGVAQRLIELDAAKTVVKVSGLI